MEAKKASAEVEAFNIVLHNGAEPMLRLFGNRSTTTSLCELFSSVV
jgi:hypothetical protein